MMSNGQTDIPEELRALVQLDNLDISGNQISKLPRWLTDLPIKTLHHEGTRCPRPSSRGCAA